MASASSLARFNSSHADGTFETIEIDPQYAQGLGFGQGDIVEIGLLHDLPFAQTIGTEPLTPDDWEIIEIHALHVESTLLSQVRVAKLGQEIDVWVLGRTRVRLRVVSVEPSTKGGAALLTTNTEVSIAPKLHKRQQVSPTQSNGKPVEAGKVAVAHDIAHHPSSSKSAKCGPSLVLRVLPARFVSMDGNEDVDSKTVFYVSPQTFKCLDPSNISSTSYPTAILKRLEPPNDPLAPPPIIPSPVHETRVLNPGNEEKGGTGAEKSKKLVYVNCMLGIPDNHIVIPVPYENIEEWDLIFLTLSFNQINKELGPLLSEFGRAGTVMPPSPDSLSLAGVANIIERCIGFCQTTFMLHSHTRDFRGVSGLLLTGGAGAGKSTLVQLIAKKIQEDSRILTYIYYVDVTQHTEHPASKVHALFKYWSEKAAWHRPTLLILDNLDRLLSAEVEHADSFRSRQLTELFLRTFSSAARTSAPNYRGTILLATASSKTALHNLLLSSHIFHQVVNILPPSKQARRDILTNIVQERLRVAQDIKEDPESLLNFTALAIQTEGYLAMDLRDLVTRALHQAAIRHANTSEIVYLTAADFAAAQVDFVPITLRDVPLQKSDVSWSDIGGLNETRRVLRETLEWPTKYGPIFSQAPLRLRSGLLLYGYPGCGKTLLASAVAKECGLNFISVKGPELLNKYIGASEKSVRDLFERASAAKPCILFFDEFDSIAPKRGHDSTGVTDRVVNQMLTQMDGAEGLEGVYILAATSRPDLIDPALLRPGRLDKALLCDMPSQDERKDILLAIGRKVSMSPSVDLDEIAAVTEGFSGADLQALLYNAHLEVVHQVMAEKTPSLARAINKEESIEYTTFGGPVGKSVRSKAEDMALQKRLHQIKKSLQSRSDNEPTMTTVEASHEYLIDEEHIYKVLKTTKPSVSPQERRRLDHIYQGFVSNRTGDLPLPPEGRNIGSRVTLG
ncbi:hypothetical protein AMATHDRAFT_57931 [Amanita thiersii Skay4041]|uniref:Peroxisomal ATPase PEX1 n=1 Tax=Amanita thiersii Skay4041 TaxID=703135 RepID=A0A2A9NM71_9AGAR|nr:hypothetical protein AMATHDRAFT_57931 [Amanita thiersii Skay4041]